jgi:hypothetical protein
LRSPGSDVEIDTKEDGRKIYFNRFFMALKPCMDGFKEGCRPYLSVDFTVLTGRWNGCIPPAIVGFRVAQLDVPCGIRPCRCVFDNTPVRGASRRGERGEP